MCSRVAERETKAYRTTRSVSISARGVIGGEWCARTAQLCGVRDFSHELHIVARGGILAVVLVEVAQAVVQIYWRLYRSSQHVGLTNDIKKRNKRYEKNKNLIIVGQCKINSARTCAERQASICIEEVLTARPIW